MMQPHALVGRFGATTFGGTAATSERVTRVDFLDDRGAVKFGVGDVAAELRQHGLAPTELGLDLILLATLVHAADTRLARRSESQDSWTREIRIDAPVHDVDRWRPTTTVLERMLNFLTGDLWSVGFHERDLSPSITAEPVGQDRRSFDVVSLFSGGLDSLVGTIDLLHGGANPLLVSHAADGATSAAQHQLLTGLKAAYPDGRVERVRGWVSVPKGIAPGIGAEDTTRGRSFLFLALGAFVGSSFRLRFDLRIPENGLIALNVPLDRLRLGALSTRTTHPFYLARWNEFLAELGMDAAVTNPYRLRTKGEMLSECANADLLRSLLAGSMSCSSPSKARWEGHGIQHCGYCLPCLIRRASIQRAFGRGGDPTAYTLEDLASRPLDARRAEGQQVRSFQYAIDRLERTDGIEKLLVYKPGPLHDVVDEVSELAAVYRRGMFEVRSILDGVRTESA